MKERKKILILEHDDFLREILGNLMHKQGAFILNEHNIEHGLARISKQDIDTVILGSSCEDYKGKQSIHYINKELGNPKIYLINHNNRYTEGIPKEQQYLKKTLSVEEIITDVLE